MLIYPIMTDGFILVFTEQNQFKKTKSDNLLCHLIFEKKCVAVFPYIKRKQKQTTHFMDFFFFPNRLSFFPQLYGIALIWTLTLAYVSLIESQLL